VIATTWTVLYIAMGYASYRVWSRGGGLSGEAKIPLLIYTISVILNWLWPLVEFGLPSLLGAIALIFILMVFVVMTGVLFFRIDMLAGLLFVPYFGFLIYSIVLNIHIYILNN